MPADAYLTDRGRELIDELPGWAREDPDLRALMHVFAKEGDRIQERMEEVRDNFIPLRATELGLPWWEHALQLPVNPPGQSVEERRGTVITAIFQSIPDPAGLRWESILTQIAGSGWSYVENANARTLVVTLPVPAGSPLLAEVELRLRPYTPAHLLLTIQSSSGFTLDLSQLDTEAFAG